MQVVAELNQDEKVDWILCEMHVALCGKVGTMNNACIIASTYQVQVYKYIVGRDYWRGSGAERVRVVRMLSE